ncbi:histidine kinase [Parabacteroides sp.]
MKPRIVSYKYVLIDLLLDPKYSFYRHSALIFSFVLIALNGAVFTYLRSEEPWNQVRMVAIMESILLSVLYLVSVYLNIYVLVPRYLIRDRIPRYIALCSLLVLFILTAQLSVEYWAVCHYNIEPGDSFYFGGRRIFVLEMVAAFLMHSIMLVGSAAPVLFKYWIESERRKDELEKDNLRTELKDLKKQVQPRFLLNTLSKAKELAIDRPDLSSTLLMRLSKLLRYQLYDCTRNQVFLTSEITFLENYLELQAIRSSTLRYEITGQGDIRRILLPPLLFLPFIEYLLSCAFARKNPYVHLSFERQIQNRFSFVASLSGQPDNRDRDIDPDLSLATIRQRLELLYRDAWELDIHKEEETISISLQIQL